jgi:hypothetical protein
MSTAMSTLATLPAHLRAPRARRATLLAKWPLGLTLTSWRYMWRVTPLHRREMAGDPLADAAPDLPEWLDRSHLQDADAGVGPLFHRRYRAAVRDSAMAPEELMTTVTSDLDAIAPSEMVSFDKVRGGAGVMSRNDEYVVRMPAPWDGPVRVVDVTPTSFWLVTLTGHIEAGQIQFRALREDGLLAFEIESWARNGDLLASLLYDRLRMAKEVQLHMWTSVLERIARMAGGRLAGGVAIETRRMAVG